MKSGYRIPEKGRTVMDTAEKLLAIEEIHQLKARYFRFVDTKQWDALRDIFTADATFDGDGSGMGVLADRDEFVRNASTSLTDCVSVHHGHCPEITITSETTASGIWPMEDMLRWDESSASPIRSVHGMGHYHETYEKVAGEWKIKSWNLTRLRVDTVPA